MGAFQSTKAPHMSSESIIFTERCQRAVLAGACACSFESIDEAVIDAVERLGLEDGNS